MIDIDTHVDVDIFVDLDIFVIVFDVDVDIQDNVNLEVVCLSKQDDADQRPATDAAPERHSHTQHLSFQNLQVRKIQRIEL